LIVFFVPGRKQIPTQTITKRQVRSYLPAVLAKQSYVLVAQVKALGIALPIVAGHAQQKVGKVRSRLGSLELEGAVENGIWIDVDLIEMQSAAHLEAVLANQVGEAVGRLIGVVDLGLAGRIHAEGVVVERNVLDALNLRIQGNDAQRARAFDKPLRAQLGSHASHRLA